MYWRCLSSDISSTGHRPHLLTIRPNSCIPNQFNFYLLLAQGEVVTEDWTLGKNIETHQNQNLCKPTKQKYTNVRGSFPLAWLPHDVVWFAVAAAAGALVALSLVEIIKAKEPCNHALGLQTLLQPFVHWQLPLAAKWGLGKCKKIQKIGIFCKICGDTWLNLNSP